MILQTVNLHLLPKSCITKPENIERNESHNSEAMDSEMFAATYFTGDNRTPFFAFIICLKSFKLENMDQPPKNKSNIFPAVEDSLL